MTRTPRISLRALFLMIAYLAITLAMLRAPSDLALRLVTTGLFVLILVTTLAAIVDAGPYRIRAAGFALFGATYWLASVVPALAAIGERLPHAWFIEFGLPLIRPDLPFTLGDDSLARRPKGFESRIAIETVIVLSAALAGGCGWLIGGVLRPPQSGAAPDTSS